MTKQSTGINIAIMFDFDGKCGQVQGLMKTLLCKSSEIVLTDILYFRFWIEWTMGDVTRVSRKRPSCFGKKFLEQRGSATTHVLRA